MKAVVQSQYGLPLDVLAIQEVDTPACADDEVLVRVHAASIHIGDCHLMKGLPYFLRLFAEVSAVRRPACRATTSRASSRRSGRTYRIFEVGDEVFGWCTGAFAEYACVSTTKLTTKPTGLTFEEASAVGVSAFTALHALRDRAKVQAGQKLLINGASGGVGTFAVQIAKHLGAEVTGVCSSRNVEMVQSIGADHVIDYTQEDFTQGEARYDVILDNISNHSASAFKRVLTPEGRYQPNGAQPGKWLGGLDRMAKAVVVSLYDKQQGRPFLSVQNHADLLTLKELVDAGAIQPVIDQTYPLSEAPQALAHVEAGHARAKVVIKM